MRWHHFDPTDDLTSDIEPFQLKLSHAPKGKTTEFMTTMMVGRRAMLTVCQTGTLVVAVVRTRTKKPMRLIGRRMIMSASASPTFQVKSALEVTYALLWMLQVIFWRQQVIYMNLTVTTLHMPAESRVPLMPMLNAVSWSRNNYRKLCNLGSWINSVVINLLNDDLSPESLNCSNVKSG